MMKFADKLDKIIEKNNSLVCVGLDSNIDKLPKRFKKSAKPQFKFNQWIIDQTYDLVCAYKPNWAFYEARGAKGFEELKETMIYLKKKCPEVVTIADAKRADIGTTNMGYVESVFGEFKCDAVTLHPYLGKEAVEPFLQRIDKGCVVLCRTSNPGAGEFQDLVIDGKSASGRDKPLWQVVAEKVKNEWNVNNNCMLVVGATYPKELKKVREIVGEMTLLVPGVGAQGGEVKATVKAGLNSAAKGMMINSSRGIIFSDNPREETKKLKDSINQYR